MKNSWIGNARPWDYLLVARAGRMSLEREIDGYKNTGTLGDHLV